MANQREFKYSLSIGGKSVPGRILIDYDNGNAEWYKLSDVYPTFNSSRNTGGSGKWGWTPSTSDSIPNLRNSLPVGLFPSDDALRKAFYTDSIKGLNNVRSDAFNRNAPQTGKTLGVPGARNTSGTPGVQPPQPADPTSTTQTPSAPTLPSPEQIAASGLLPTITQTENKSMIATYPLKMSGLQDRIKFTALEYIASGNISNLSLQSRDRTSNLEGKKPLGHVFLPVQAAIGDANSVDWQGSSLNEIQRKAVNLSTSIMNATSAKEVGNNLLNGLEGAANDLMKNSNAVKVALAGEAVGIQNLLGRFGATLNPNLELLFSGPALRPFSFRFQMSAREKEEADNILKIINFFKKNMAPRTTKDNIFLKAPNTFLIEYKYKGSEQEHPGINKIKECALLNCSVDYTPLGSYMTYENGSMVSYSMTLSFQELEPIYDKDYDGKHPIGY